MSAIPKPAIGRTVESPRMRRAQQRHAIAVVVLSAMGILLAIGLAIAGYPPGWTEFAIFVVFFTIAGLGISVGFHRMFTHQSFKATTAVRVALAIMGSMAMQGTLKFWVALHRRHHEHSDEAGDPHSPYVLEEFSPNQILVLRRDANGKLSGVPIVFPAQYRQRQLAPTRPCL